MATKTDAEGLVLLERDSLPDASHLEALRSLILDAQESLDDTAQAIACRTNSASGEDVTYDLIGQLAVTARRIRESIGWMEESLRVIEGSLEDLGTLADGCEIDSPAFNQHGTKRPDQLESWRDSVSDALGIERLRGGYSDYNAKEIAARLSEVEGGDS